MFYSIKNVYLARDRKNKDYCYVVLTRDTIDYLKKYLAEYQPHYWLFEGEKGRQYSERSIQSVFTNAKLKSGEMIVLHLTVCDTVSQCIWLIMVFRFQL
jgi:hypothetical protein